MIYGVDIGGVDTLQQWGLLLCADLKNDAPELKSNMVDIPGRSGSVNMSYVVSNGQPVFEDREISFTLFAPVDDVTLNQIRAELAALCHGREQTLTLPTDPTHYYRGVFAVGRISGYNSGKIPVEVLAEPYAYKNDQTEISSTIPAVGSVNITLTNEMMPATVTVTASDDITLTVDETAYSIPVGTTTLPITLTGGETEITVAGEEGETVQITYQEGRI